MQLTHVARNMFRYRGEARRKIALRLRSEVATGADSAAAHAVDIHATARAVHLGLWREAEQAARRRRELAGSRATDRGLGGGGARHSCATGWPDA